MFLGALALPLLALVFLAEVLFHDKSLSAFDLYYYVPGWQMFADIPYQNSLLSDNPSVHHPERQVNWSAMRQGYRLSLNPFIFSGAEYPLPGAGAYLTGFPLFFMDLPDGLDWATFVRLSLAGIFMYVLLLVLRLPVGAAVFGGVVWSYGLNRIAWLEFPQHLSGELWIPLVLAFYLLMLRERLSLGAGVGLFVSMLLLATSGYNQITAYLLLTLGVFGLFHTMFAGDVPWGERLKRLIVAQAVLAAALLPVLPGLLYEKGLIAEGMRGVQDFRWQGGAVETGWKAIAGLLAHSLPSSFDLERFISPFTLGAIWNYPVFNYRQNTVEYGIYFGIPALFFAAFSVMALRDRVHRGVWLALVATLLFLFALYHDDRIVRGLVNLLPGFKFGSYSRLIAIILFVLAVLAAYGLSFAAARVNWRLLVFLGTAALLVAVYVYLHRWGAGWVRLERSARYYPAMVGLALVAATLALLWMRERREGIYFGVVAAIAAADLFAVTWTFNTKLANELIFPPNPVVKYLAGDAEDFRVVEVAAGRDAKSTFRANTLSYYGLPAVEGYLTTVRRDYLRLITTLNPRSSVRINGIVTFHEIDPRFVRTLGVKYVISDHALAHPELDEAYTDRSGLRVYRVRNSLPRVYCADRFEVYDTDEEVFKALPALLTESDRPVAVSRGVGGTGMEIGKDIGGCEVADVRVGAHGVTAAVRSDAGGVLFIPYVHSDRWATTIDGRAADLFKANYAFMAVEIPGGAHEVRIRFRNMTLGVGAAAQGLAGLGLLVLAFAMRRWRFAFRTVIAAVGIFLAGINLIALRSTFGETDLPEAYLKRGVAQAPAVTAETPR